MGDGLKKYLKISLMKNLWERSSLRVLCHFFAFCNLVFSLPDVESGKLNLIMGYGNPSIFGTKYSEVRLLIDGTFRILPHQFYRF